MRKPIQLAWTRDFTLPWTEWWSRDMHPRLQEVFGKGIPNQLSYFNGRMLETYRLVHESKEFMKAVVDSSLHSPVLSEPAINRYIFLNKKIRRTIEENRRHPVNSATYNATMKDVAEMYPWYTASYLLPQQPWVVLLTRAYRAKSKLILRRLLRARQASEGTIEFLIEYWRGIAQALLKARKMPTEYASFVTLTELESMLRQRRYRLDSKVLAERSERYIFFRDSVCTGISLATFLRRRGFRLTKEKVKASRAFAGTVCSPGPASIVGRASVILTNDEVKRFRPGNILVTVMTNPFFLPIMKKAKAIVTDEGGVTCHAAIVARELKKPCVIGTKIATRVLKDGDRVEVDATKGIVRKI